MKSPARSAGVISLFFMLFPFLLQAKIRSEITIDTYHSRWYNSPLFWLGAALFFTFLLILVLRSGRKKKNEPVSEDQRSIG
jgi:hypothetical protein